MKYAIKQTVTINNNESQVSMYDPGIILDIGSAN